MLKIKIVLKMVAKIIDYQFEILEKQSDCANLKI